MNRLFFTVAALAVVTSPVFAAAPSKSGDIAVLESRIQALEANAVAMRQQAAEAMEALQAARAEIEQIKATQDAGESLGQTDSPSSPIGSSLGADSNAFNPAIAIILNGQYAHHSLDPDAYSWSGFALAGEAGPGAQGLSLGESELALSANIDDKFYGQLTLAVESEDGEAALGIEEAFIDTTSMPAGMTLRAGRFFSNIGYLNNHHAHTDKFSDRPLAYQAFLGNQYGDDGIQLRWVAPTDLFIEVGGEILRGQNFPSGGAEHEGAGVLTLFAHAGGDVGLEASWLAGLSMLRAQTDSGDDGFRGDNSLYVVDATWKWAPDGNTKDGGIQLRSEFFFDDREGEYIDAVDPLLDQAWDGQRRGAYVEGVYRINRQWEAGYRHDRLWADDDGPYASNFDPFRHSAMLTWRNSEFSLLRLQLGRDNPNAVDSDDVISMQYQTALGAHGAHKF